MGWCGVGRIPVWRTIGSAYAFVFAHLATILGIVWLPLVLLSVAEYLAIARYLDATLAALAAGNRFAVYGAAAYLYLYMIVSVFLAAVIAVPIFRQALGLTTRGRSVHLALGWAELRVFGALVAFYIVMQVMGVIAVIVWGLLAIALLAAARVMPQVGGIASGDIVMWANRAAVAVVAGIFVFAYVRLSMVLVPQVVAEKRIDLVRSWSLTRGNFWRSLFVVLVVGAPGWFLFVTVQYALVGFAVLGDALSVVPMANQFTASTAEAVRKVQLILAWLPTFFAIRLAVQPVALGLASGAAAAAYRALVPDPAALSTPEPDGPPPAAFS